jgi:hypothetical protein
MAGLPKQYMKMGLKDGWKAYKKTSAYKKKHGGGSTTKKRPAKKKTTTRKTARRSNPVAKRAAPRPKKHNPGPMFGQIKTEDIIDRIVRAFGIMVGSLGGSLTVNAIPIKNPWAKIGIQSGAGLITSIAAPWPILEGVGNGMLAGAMTSAAKNTFPDAPFLAGESYMGALTPGDIQGALTAGDITPEEAQLLLEELQGEPVMLGVPEDFATMGQDDAFVTTDDAI